MSEIKDGSQTIIKTRNSLELGILNKDLHLSVFIDSFLVRNAQNVFNWALVSQLKKTLV